MEASREAPLPPPAAMPGTRVPEPLPIPTADPNCFSILVARLEDDPDRKLENLIIKELENFEAIQVLPLGRIIASKGEAAEDKKQSGRQRARGYLKKSGASVCIWGRVLSSGEAIAPKLYWTTPEECGESRYATPADEAQFHLPVAFWPEEVNILRLLAASRVAEFGVGDDPSATDRLLSRISDVQALLEASGENPAWNAYARGATRLILANALDAYGRRTGKKKFLQDAVSAYREALGELEHDQAGAEETPELQKGAGETLASSLKKRLQTALGVPRDDFQEYDLGMSRTDLGDALAELGRREGSPEFLAQAVSTCRAAVEELNGDPTSLERKRALSSLGFSLLLLGVRERDPELLGEAVSTFREALEDLDRARYPLTRARAKARLGAALSGLGTLGRDLALLREGVSDHREAIEDLKPARARHPLYWIEAQAGLGDSLREFGTLESSMGVMPWSSQSCILHFKEARQAYREALEEPSLARNPLERAEILINLGDVSRRQGTVQGDSEWLREAVSACRDALDALPKDDDPVPLEEAQARANLGAALRALGIMENNPERLAEAVSACKAALEVFTRPAYEKVVDVEELKRILLSAETLLGARGTEDRQKETRPPVQ